MLGEIANFRKVNLPKNVIQSYGHFMFGFTFWQFDFFDDGDFSLYSI
jgi:hypothetical protein